MPHKDPAKAAAAHRDYRTAHREHLNACDRASKARRPPAQVRGVEQRQFAGFYVRLGGRATHMLNNARSRAKKNGLPMTLTREWVLERLKRGVCEVTGLPLVLSTGHGRGHNGSAFSPSLDRRIGADGYTPENVRMVCWIYNRARGAFPDADFETMCHAYLAMMEKK